MDNIIKRTNGIKQKIIITMMLTRPKNTCWSLCEIIHVCENIKGFGTNTTHKNAKRLLSLTMANLINNKAVIRVKRGYFKIYE